jgi:hypothetical protein
MRFLLAVVLAVWDGGGRDCGGGVFDCWLWLYDDFCVSCGRVECF